MSALPAAQPVEAADAELMADLAAHLRGASASQFLNAALHGLSPSEVRFADEASVRAERQADKAAAWDRLKTDHPESAAVIAEFGRVFGRLERVIVRQENRTVFDSKTYR